MAIARPALLGQATKALRGVLPLGGQRHGGFNPGFVEADGTVGNSHYRAVAVCQ